MRTTLISSETVEDHVFAPYWVPDSRKFLHLPDEIVGMILENLPFEDLRSTRQTCKRLGILGIRPLFRDHLVNLDGKDFIKFVEMSKQPTVAASICSLTLCSFRLLPPDDGNGLDEPVYPAEGWWETFASIHIRRINPDIIKSLQASYLPGDYSEGSSTADVYFNLLSTALSKLTRCKKIALKDLKDIGGDWMSDHRHLPVPLMSTTMAFMRSDLLPVMCSTIKMEHLDILIGDRQEHPRSIAIDMLPDLEQVYSFLRRLHISIDSKFIKPAQLQAFLLSFPNISNFSLRVSSNVYHVKSLGVLRGLIIPKLEELSLDAVECTAAELEGFLLRHTQTLQRVSLTRISSISDTQSWLGILHKSRHYMSLSHFSAHQCLQQEGLDVAHIAEFARAGYDSLESSTSCESYLDGQAATERDPDMAIRRPE